MSTIKKQSFIWHLIIYFIMIGGIYGLVSLLDVILDNYPSLRSFFGYAILFLLILYASIVSYFSDESAIDSKKIKDIMFQIELQDSTSSLLENFDEMQDDLNRVQLSIQKLLNDLKIQKDLFAEEKEKADICKQFVDMNSDKISALKKTFQSVLDGEHKKTKKSTIIWNAIFCIISFILGKMF